MNTATAGNGHPRGLYLLFFTEMWERFSYYGMRAIFILFMTKALFIDKALASNIYGSYTGLVYLTPLLGGYISDRFWGNRRSILVGGLIMAAGQFLMFVSGSTISEAGQSASAISMMWAGLTLLIIGNGFFKPNISTMVGQLYPRGDHRIDGAFTIFYMGINLGAFFSPLVCGGLGDTGNIADFKWGFLAACIGMLVSTISFELLKKKLLVTPEGEPVGMPKARMDAKTFIAILGSVAFIFFLLNFNRLFHSDLDVIGYLIYAAIVVMPLIIYSDKSLTSDEKQRISVIFILAFFVVFFWGCFEQAGASLTLFADEQTDRMIGGWEMPASWFQSINPLAIIALAPLFTMFWNFLSKRKMEPSSPLKMAFGLILVALGFVVIAFAVHGLAPGQKIAMWWLWALYLLHTMGELSLSPIGLSMVSKLAPVRFASLLMGTWFLANAVANKFAGTLSALIPPGAGEAPAEAGAKLPTFLGIEISNLFIFFCVFIALSGTAAVVLLGMYRWLEKRMHGVK
jgi:POT family proton-dependent oligopeptide transporter